MGEIITDKPTRVGKSVTSWARALALALILAGLAARVVFLGIFPDSPSKFDQATYLRQARKLQQIGLVEWKFNQIAPGYIAFLAGAFEVSGGADKDFVRLAQALLGATTVAVVYGITQLTFANVARRARSRIALLAAALWTFYPDALFLHRPITAKRCFYFLRSPRFIFSCAPIARLCKRRG